MSSSRLCPWSCLCLRETCSALTSSIRSILINRCFSFSFCFVFSVNEPVKFEKNFYSPTENKQKKENTGVSQWTQSTVFYHLDGVDSHFTGSWENIVRSAFVDSIFSSTARWEPSRSVCEELGWTTDGYWSCIASQGTRARRLSSPKAIVLSIIRAVSLLESWLDHHCHRLLCRWRLSVQSTRAVHRVAELSKGQP